MKTCLVDVNVLLALTWPHHIHHDLVHQWWQTTQVGKWSSCTQTQLGFVRLSCNPKFARVPATPVQAVDVLTRMIARTDHEFGPDIPDGALDAGLASGLSSCHSHAQVTDAYLAVLAAHHDGQLVTLDGSLAVRHPNVAIFVG